MDNEKYKKVQNLMKIMVETFGYEPKTPGVVDLEKFDQYAKNDSDAGTIIESPMKDDILSMANLSMKESSVGKKSTKRVTIRESVNILGELDEIVKDDHSS